MDTGLETDCGCGHRWSEHQRTDNGSFSCAYSGCGCRDVVYPLHVAQPETHYGPPGSKSDDVASSKLQELGTLLMQDDVIQIDDHNTGVGHAEPSHTDRRAIDLASTCGG